MYFNNVFTGTTLLNRILKVIETKYGAEFEDIGLVTLHTDGENRPYFIVNDNAMGKIGTVSKKELLSTVNQKAAVV